MSISLQIANHLRHVYFGGNWTSVNLKQTLADVDWQMAIQKKDGYNTIVTLLYHLNYYVYNIAKVLEGEPLTASDKVAFDHPQVQNQNEWEQLKEKCWADAEHFAGLIEKLDDTRLSENFIDAKYGSWFRNLQGIIEHIHYHLGQIVIIKKRLSEN